MAPFSVAPGQSDLDRDAGVLATPASVGDRVWYDADNDGVQDAGELGVAGVTVHLLRSDGTEAAATMSDPDGIYGFANVMPGSYSVKVDLPAGYRFSPLSVGSDASLDSDIDPTTATTAAFTLAPAQSDTDLDSGISITPGSVGHSKVSPSRTFCTP